MVLSLCHLKELGYDAQELLAWLGEYTVNRFTHPDASWYNGADYRYPSRCSTDVDTFNPQHHIPSWKTASDSIIDKHTALVGDNPVNYPRKAFAALSCLTDVTIRQMSHDGGIDRNITGQLAYDWLGGQFSNNEVWNDNPNWAIIPRVEIPPVCGNEVCERGESASCPQDCPVVNIPGTSGSMLLYVPSIISNAH